MTLLHLHAELGAPGLRGDDLDRVTEDVVVVVCLSSKFIFIAKLTALDGLRPALGSALTVGSPTSLTCS
jgi:hypothetical protein